MHLLKAVLNPDFEMFFKTAFYALYFRYFIYITSHLELSKEEEQLNYLKGIKIK